MIRLRVLRLIALLLMLGFCGSASAAKTYKFFETRWGGLYPTSLTCSAFVALISGAYNGPGGTCDGLDEALHDAASGTAQFTFTAGFGYVGHISVTQTGSCSSGADAGTFEVFAGYWNVSTGHTEQLFADPDPFSYKGCMIKLKADLSCRTKAEESEIAPGIKNAYCTSSFVETGDDGGADQEPTIKQVPYNGGGTGGGGTDPGTGGGTDPGTGGGGTNPGTGGGGTDPGTGGGGTDPGTGGGGTDPGTGNGGNGTGTDFCSLHPGSSVCQNSSVSGGCADFVCNGDAIQCATLREVHDANCKIAADEAAAKASGIGKLGQGVLDGNDPDADKLPRPGNGANISMPSLDQSGWLGGGECFSDKTFYILGRDVTIPFSRACSALVVLRYALMIVAALASFKMLAGAIFRE